MKFITNLDLDQTSCAKNDMDPVALAFEIGQGIEELTVENIRLGALNNAAKALEASIDLDNQIAAAGAANRGTVTYGVEALEMTAIFLGANSNFDDIAAGLEDNDQEGAAEKKEGFLEKIKNAAIEAWNKIIKIIKDIIDKVKSFFGSKATEKVVEKAKEVSKEVTEKLGSDSKKPECDEDKVETEKKNIVKQAPGYIYLKGMESTDDIREAINMYLDDETVSTLEEMKNYFSKNMAASIDALSELTQEIKNGKTLNSFNKELLDIGKNLVKNLQPEKLKQNKLREELAKKFETEILKDAGLYKDKNDLDYKIIISGDKLDTNGNLELSYIIFTKNKYVYKEYEKHIDELKSYKDLANAINGLMKKITSMNGKYTTSVNETELMKKVKPITGKDIEDLADEIEKMEKRGETAFKNFESIVNELEKEINKNKDKIKQLNFVVNTIKPASSGILTTSKTSSGGIKITLGDNISAYISRLLNATSDIIKTAAQNSSTKLNSLTTNVLNLTTKCLGEPKSL